MGNLEQALGGPFIPDQYIGKRAYTTYDPPRIGARKAMQSAGMAPPATWGIGQIFRFPDKTDLEKGRSGGSGGWAVYYEFVEDNEIVGICVFGSHHGDFEPIKWCNKHPEYMTTCERNQFEQRIQSAQEQIEAMNARRQADAALEAAKIWESAREISGNPYTQRKKITPIGARHNGKALILPVRDKDGIKSLQYIADDGTKQFLKGGKTKGCWMLLEGAPDNIYITEGWATGCTIHEATGASVYVAWHAGNIYDVAAYVRDTAAGRITIAADDDYSTAGNPGLNKARQAADVFGFNLVAPVFKGTERGTDFNDMACLDGLDAVKEHLAPRSTPVKTAEPEETPKSTVFTPPKGAIADIAAYYNATSGNNQPGFAIQTAIALVSLVCGRYFITDLDNTTALYLLNVGKSATGKEHCKKIMDRILYACNLEHYIAGDGFTSGAAVHSLLQSHPVCGVVIDEFGKYLEAAANAKGGMQKEANTTLMEVIGRPDGILRPKNYSAMTISKEQADAMRDKYVLCPSLTLLGLTTPSTFFDQIKLASVLDGFLNRFLVYVSDAGRAPRKRTAMFDVPENIKDWIGKIRHTIKEANPLELSTEEPNRKIIRFTEEALVIQEGFELEMIELQNNLEKIRLDALPGRANEWAMRLSLCLALARDPHTNHVQSQDMQWAVDYVRASTMTLLAEVKDNVSENFVEANKKEILAALREYSSISWKVMQMTPPFMKYSQKELKEVLQSLVDAELIETTQENKNGRGRPVTVYKATS